MPSLVLTTASNGYFTEDLYFLRYILLVQCIITRLLDDYNAYMTGKIELQYIDVYFSSHLSLNREGRLGTTDDFTTSFLHFSLFSTALLDLANSKPVHSLVLSSHLFLCLPFLPPFTVPCKMVLDRPDEWET